MSVKLNRHEAHMALEALRYYENTGKAFAASIKGAGRKADGSEYNDIEKANANKRVEAVAHVIRTIRNQLIP